MGESLPDPRLRRLRFVTHRTTDRCNSELNHLATKYYELVRLGRRGNTNWLASVRREANYRGKHSLSPLPLKVYFDLPDTSRRAYGSLTPEPKRAVVTKLEGTAIIGTLSREQQTTTKDISASQVLQKVRKEQRLPALPMAKRTEQRDKCSFPSLRKKKRIDIDLRVARKLECRVFDKSGRWSINSSVDLSRPEV